MQPWRERLWGFARHGLPKRGLGRVSSGRGSGAVISVHLGARGFSIAEELWPLLRASMGSRLHYEHPAEAGGEVLWYEAETLPGFRHVPRAVLVDCGEGAPAAALLQGVQRRLFHPRACVASGESAMGGGSFEDESVRAAARLAMERCRAFAEAADSLQGVMLVYSADGGAATKVARCLLREETFKDILGSCNICGVTTSSATSDVSRPETQASRFSASSAVRAVLDLRHGEADVGVLFSDTMLEAAAGSPGTLSHTGIMGSWKDTVVACWLDLFSQSWRGSGGGECQNACSFGDALENCGISWHPSLKFILPSFQAKTALTALPEAVQDLYSSRGLLFDIGTASSAFARCHYLSAQVFAGFAGQCNAEGSRMLQRACRDQTRRLRFADFVEREVSIACQGRLSAEKIAAAKSSPGIDGAAFQLAGATNHTGFGLWLQAQLERTETASGSEAELAANEVDACKALANDFDGAAHDLLFSAGTGALPFGI
eukprot:gnl/TRDRNA2_/TRDRNA2_90903_c0_seq1.p1 gnl/TRDRNA2_/TRDRNA2_90903_c0~~gnl/TRDRNA2_/TRDRNA2_90903_c0_seq1.p1  ORF type:complete len:545 (-),score=68.05 gnl/TRDRNA2_/TRDRNA2_90903_c0_seq1:27-1493(-)